MKIIKNNNYKDKYGRNRRVPAFKNKTMAHLGFSIKKAHSKIRNMTFSQKGWEIHRFNQPIFYAYTLKDIDFYLSKMGHEVSMIANLMMLYYKAKGNITSTEANNDKIEINKSDLIMDFEDLAIYANSSINKESA